MVRQIRQEGSERRQRSEAQEIGLAAGFIRNVRELNLSCIEPGRIGGQIIGARMIDDEDGDARAFGRLERCFRADES